MGPLQAQCQSSFDWHWACGPQLAPLHLEERGNYLPTDFTEDPKIEYQGYLGSLAVRLGARAGAERIAESLGALAERYRFGQHTYCRARIASLLGEKDKAVDLLRAAFSHGCRFSISVHRDPDFEPLRDYPSYRELLRPKG